MTGAKNSYVESNPSTELDIDDRVKKTADLVARLIKLQSAPSKALKEPSHT